MLQFLSSEVLGCPVWVLLWVACDLTLIAWALRQWWLKRQLSIENVCVVTVRTIDGKEYHEYFRKEAWLKPFAEFLRVVEQDLSSGSGTPFTGALRFVSYSRIDYISVDTWERCGAVWLDIDFGYIGDRGGWSHLVWTRWGETVKYLIQSLSPDGVRPLSLDGFGDLLQLDYHDRQWLEKWIAGSAIIRSDDASVKVANLMRCFKEINASARHAQFFDPRFFGGDLPGTTMRVMELLTTDKGTERVLACIRRGGKAAEPPQRHSAGIVS